MQMPLPASLAQLRRHFQQPQSDWRTEGRRTPSSCLSAWSLVFLPHPCLPLSSLSLSDAPLCSAHPAPLLLLRLRLTPRLPGGFSMYGCAEGSDAVVGVTEVPGVCL
ncbi:hypothetical protein ATANTOWER_009733 [Ataeniobius toweri]|uniref:Uncharacterized protein n=1 Tax=Ataeniobius toweri TaxID=208326 RepID=A0ABU7CAK8_9TELE|nr:hypothetical protein [Ataeniobius toweri]